MTEQSNVVTINGQEYNTDSLDDQQKYLISQIRDLQTKAEGIRFQLDQVTAAQNVFTNMLIKSLEGEAGEPEAPQAQVS
jgi:hypothetical protein